MAKYIVLHTLKKSVEEVNNAFNAGAPEMARAMAAGETPCKCIKSWSPMAYGRTDYTFCLWEADKPEEIEATLKKFGLLEYITVDSMQVDETDWEQFAKSLG